MTGKKLHIDRVLAAIAIVLLLIGVLFLANVSAGFSKEKFGTTTYYFFHQEISLVIGLILGVIAFFIPLETTKKMAFILVIASLLLMVLAFIPGIGVASGGASRWINLRFFTFQPSELLKLSFIAYLAVWLAKRNEKTTLIPFAIIIGIIVLLFLFQSNASTLFLIVAIAMIMYFSSDRPLWHIAVLVVSAIPILALFIVSEPYRVKRIMVMLHLIQDPMGLGYQLGQSLITIGSGGVFGVGLGMSLQKATSILPEIMSDSIFAVFAEEIGFIGSFILIVLFIALFWRCLKIARNNSDKFSQLFSIGFGAWIVLQAFINIGAMTGIIPLTGIPLPFISYGGSHIMMELVGLGILLNISRK